jgi:hypothetical protein
MSKMDLKWHYRQKLVFKISRPRGGAHYVTVLTVFLSIGHVHIRLYIYIYIYTPAKVKHHPIFLSIYVFTSILLKQ